MSPRRPLWMTVSKGHTHTLHALPCVSVVGLKYKYCNKNPITNMCVFPIQTLFGRRNPNFGRILRPDVRPLFPKRPSNWTHTFNFTRTHMSGYKNKHTDWVFYFFAAPILLKQTKLDKECVSVYMCVCVCGGGPEEGGIYREKVIIKRIDLDEQNNEMILYAMGESVSVVVVCVEWKRREIEFFFREEDPKMRIIPHKR